MNGGMNTCLQRTGMANVKTGIYKPSLRQHSQWCHAWRSQRLQKNRHRTAISVYTCVHDFAFHWVCVMVVGGRGKESHLNPHTRSHAHMYIQWQDRVVSPQTEGMQGKQALSERILFVLVFSPQSLFSSVNRLPSTLNYWEILLQATGEHGSAMIWLCIDGDMVLYCVHTHN